MNQISKAIYRIAIIVIVSWFVLPILGLFIRFQLTDENLSIYYMVFRALSLPSAVILTLFGTVKSEDNLKIKMEKFLWTILALGVSLLFVFIGFFGGMCGWDTSKELYQKKNNSNVTIAVRNYGCGAYDSDIPKNEIYKVFQITPYFIFFHKTDTTGLDTSLWKPNLNLPKTISKPKTNQ